MKKTISIILIMLMLISTLVPTVLAAEELINNKNQNDSSSSANDSSEEVENTNKEEQTNNDNQTENKDEALDENVESKNENENTQNNQQNENDVIVNENDDENKQQEIVGANLIGSQEIADGNYKIRSALDNKMVLDISEGSTKNRANVQIWQDTNAKQQIFNITYLNDGYYKIEAIHSGKSLDVHGGYTQNNTNVQQYESNGSSAQQWIIKDAGNGYYNIVSKCNGLNIDVNNGWTQNGTNVKMYESNGGNAQKFKFEKIEPIKGTKTIDDGTYKIRSAIDDSMVVDISAGSKDNSANVQIWKDTNAKQQKFNITYLNDGYYKIEASHSGKSLDVHGGYTKNNTNVQQYKSNGSDAQQWIIKDAGNGYYNIVSKCNGLNIDVDNGYAINGTNIKMYESNGGKAQKFKFEKIEEIKKEQTIQDGMYKIRSALDNNMVLDISAGSTSNRANVQIWKDTGARQQKFHVRYLGEGYYSIKAVHSKKSLDVKDASTAPRTNLQQYDYYGSDAQKWIIQDAGDGYYKIISKCNDLYIDIQDEKTSNGTNVQLYSKTQSNAQKFKFEATDAQAIEDGVYKIKTKLNTNMVLDIYDGSRLNGANVQLYKNNDSNAQKFRTTYLGEGYYKIECALSKKAIGLKDNGTNVQQFENNNSDTQKWFIKDLEDGTYTITSKYNNLNLDVEDGKAKNGANIHTYKPNGTDAQLFMFEPTTIQEFDGIDVSEWNRNINWSQVKNHGIDFAIIRCGYRGYGSSGTLVTDQYFKQNIEGALAQGIKVGVYFFTQAITPQEAVEEANYTLNLIRKYNITYPVIIDTEASSAPGNTGRADGLDKDARTTIVQTFCNTIRSNGYIPAVYASKHWFYDNLEQSRLAQYDTWLAHYTGSPSNPTDYVYNYTMWQYTSSGSVPGVSGNVDLNVSYKNY